MGSPANTMISARASDIESHRYGGSSEDMEKGKTKCLSGFIFLCNQRTKLECYRYRVFGLPFSQKHVLEGIKSGLKLFLYDFELKLLYGVYEATSDGSLNLEPAAFGGKFPAQVKFKIFKECLPIPESSLRHVIKENYSGFKFKQELCGKQVTELISSFRPLPAPLCNPGLQAPANVPLAAAMPPLPLENQLKKRRLPMAEVPYSAEVQYSHIRPSAQVHPVLKVNYPEHGSHRRAAYVENATPTLDHQSFPAANHYVSHPQQLMHAKDFAHQVQMQESSYSRYPIVEQRAPHDEFVRYHQLPPHREPLYQDNVPSHNSSSTATDIYTPSYPQLPSQGRQYRDSIAAYGSNSAASVQCTTSDYSQQVDAAYFPMQREASHQDNATAYNSNLMAVAQYASSVMQRLEPVPYDQSSLRGTQYQGSIQREAQYSTPVSQATYLPPEREALYQDNVVPYNPEPIVPAQSTSIWQPTPYLPVQSEASHQVNMGAYNSNPMVAGPNIPVGQPEVLPYASAPVPSYYSYPGY